MIPTEMRFISPPPTTVKSNTSLFTVTFMCITINTALQRKVVCLIFSGTADKVTVILYCSLSSIKGLLVKLPKAHNSFKPSVHDTITAYP